ncbi:hypothetical protein BDV96DRAFT_195707 [Lophiotrema nucula]|uniref:C2H2-type domain-containing protein n=1 Tax=Lophiotrema nucula TaxID=690887 RepID=A0A6A5YUL1_9PLEO|nr:hypothetical protein BDV96DRAFT_195707 [Lophiotrema nucula]
MSSEYPAGYASTSFYEENDDRWTWGSILDDHTEDSPWMVQALTQTTNSEIPNYASTYNTKDVIVSMNDTPSTNITRDVAGHFSSTCPAYTDDVERSMEASDVPGPLGGLSASAFRIADAVVSDGKLGLLPTFDPQVDEYAINNLQAHWQASPDASGNSKELANTARLKEFDVLEFSEDDSFPSSSQETTSTSSSSPENIECGQCGSTFTDRKYYNQHVKIHAKPHHKCSLCGRSFKHTRDLRRHQRTHDIISGPGMQIRTGEFFYCEIPSCVYATRGFARRDNYLRHLRNQHRETSQQGTTASRTSKRL